MIQLSKMESFHENLQHDLYILLHGILVENVDRVIIKKIDIWVQQLSLACDADAACYQFRRNCMFYLANWPRLIMAMLKILCKGVPTGSRFQITSACRRVFMLITRTLRVA